jgi:methylmalonyl-CoA/ethylmalonyl-CoA epimerase
VGVAVANMRRALQWYQDAFGMRLSAGPVNDPAQRVQVALLTDGSPGAGLELIMPLGEDSPIARYLHADSSSYHICYEVPDIAEAVAGLKRQGCLVISGPSPAVAFEGRPAAWLYLPDRHLVELLQRHA